jgi:hypothetical protein
MFLYLTHHSIFRQIKMYIHVISMYVSFYHHFINHIGIINLVTYMYIVDISV